MRVPKQAYSAASRQMNPNLLGPGSHSITALLDAPMSGAMPKMFGFFITLYNVLTLRVQRRYAAQGSHAVFQNYVVFKVF